MDLFHDMTYGSNINSNANFKSFYVCMILLVRSTTGENWNYIMADMYEQYGFSAIVYWILFVIILQFMFINIFVAVVYEAFIEI